MERMNKAFEKILKRLEEERELSYADFSRYVEEVSPCLDAEYDDFFHRGLERASRLVKEVAEEFATDTNVGTNGWIPCSERLPEELKRIRAKKTCNKEKCDTKEICRICVVDDAIEIVKQGGLSNRKDCEYRHENGNCLKVGGFCTSVDDKHCEKIKQGGVFDDVCEWKSASDTVFLTKSEAEAKLKELREKNETLKALYEDARKEGNNLLKRERNKAIDDLQNELKNHYTEYNIDCVLADTSFYSYTTACNYLEDYIDEIAEQLKAGEIYD